MPRHVLRKRCGSQTRVRLCYHWMSVEMDDIKTTPIETRRAIGAKGMARLRRHVRIADAESRLEGQFGEPESDRVVDGLRRWRNRSDRHVPLLRAHFGVPLDPELRLRPPSNDGCCISSARSRSHTMTIPPINDIAALIERALSGDVNVAVVIQQIADAAGVRYHPDGLDKHAEAMARLSDAAATLEDTQWLLVALYRGRVITGAQQTALHGAYLRQKYP